MKMLKFSCKLCKIPVRNELTLISRTLSRSLSTQVEEEYSSEPNYPPILDLSWDARRGREIRAWHNKIQNLGTIEEKMIEVNMPRFYGWNCHMVNEGSIPYNGMAFIQHITKTHFINGLPAFYQEKDIDDAANECLSKVKSQVTEALLYELQRELPIEKEEGVSPQQIEFARNQAVIQQVHSVLSAILSPHLPHIQQSQFDSEPRIEAAWTAGGMDPPLYLKESLEKIEWMKEYASRPTDRHIQYTGRPLLQVRSDMPLKPYVTLEESEKPELEMPSFTLDPQVYFLELKHRHKTNIPGFWPGEKQQFGLMSFHSRSFLSQRPDNYGADEHLEALHTQAILASYGWLLPQACYLGFSPFTELTTPLTAQTVVTDGRLWSLYAYQLNTTLLSELRKNDNARKNICWGTKPLHLFESIQDGKLVGFSENVLKIILKMYMNVPADRMDAELRPYLDPTCSMVAKIEDPKRRDFLEKLFKYLNSNRPRHKPLPEIWDWEEIYKIKFQTRPMDARRRYFELWQRPWQRRLDDHPGVYVPKALRENRKEKFAKMYYP